MGSTLPIDSRPRHRELPEKADRMVSADLRKAETERESREKVGAAVRRCRTLSGLTLKEFAGLLRRDERQVARWETGDERVHVDAIERVPMLHLSWMQAQGELLGAKVNITLEMGRRSA